MPSPRRLISSVISLVLLVIGIADPSGFGIVVIAIGVIGLVLNGMLIQRDRAAAQAKGEQPSGRPGARGRKQK